MRTPYWIAASLIGLAVSTSSAHMGKYPCRVNADLVQQIRELSTRASEKGSGDVAAMLDLAADAAYHCWQDAMTGVMREFMEKGNVKTLDDAAKEMHGGTERHGLILHECETIKHLERDFIYCSDLSGMRHLIEFKLPSRMDTDNR